MDVLTITLVTAAAALVVLALGVWAYRRLTRPESSGRDDRYTPERVLTPEQAHMLDYLQDTFPGQVVLPNMMLKDMLTVRRASNRKRAEERLNEHKVDFVVCGEDGRPSFAFDVEQHHLSDARAKAHRVKMKNRILKTAGVRFVFLKNGIHRMPSPAEFRAQLNLAELPKPKPKEEGRESAMQQLESQFSGFDGHERADGPQPDQRPTQRQQRIRSPARGQPLRRQLARRARRPVETHPRRAAHDPLKGARLAARQSRFCGCPG
jgi:hypothetical protein